MFILHCATLRVRRQRIFNDTERKFMIKTIESDKNGKIIALKGPTTYDDGDWNAVAAVMIN